MLLQKVAGVTIHTPRGYKGSEGSEARIVRISIERWMFGWLIAAQIARSLSTLYLIPWVALIMSILELDAYPPHRLGLRGRLDDLDCNHIAITVPSEHTGKVAYERGHMVLNLHMTS